MRRMLDVLADLPRPAMRGDLLLAEEHGDPIVVGADEYGLAGQAPGHTVAIAVEGDAKGLGHGAGLDIIDIEGHVGDRFEAALLLVPEHQRGHLASLVVPAVICSGIAPFHRLRIEGHQVGGTATAPETGAHEDARPFDAPPLVALSDVASDDREVAHPGAFEETTH